MGIHNNRRRHSMLDMKKCRTKTAELISDGRTVALQCGPSHVGIPGKERANQKAKQGAESAQPEAPLTLRREKSIISLYIYKYTAMTQKTKSFGKPLEILTIVDAIPRHLKRAEAIAHFHLFTGHDFLGIYLHLLGMAANEACPLDGHAGMNGDHLFQWTRLDEYPADNIISRY
ncbi:reverse transcriptase [Trichonephila clavipes]|nr:reverse transcriptase [Trichonephila clavipes]